MSELRQRLLGAGPQLTGRHAFAELSGELIASAAGLGVEQFAESFPSVVAYVDALQEQFLDEVRNRVIKVTTETVPGLLRMKLATESYLATCIEYRGLRGWFIEARLRPELSDSLRRRNQIYGVVIGSEFSHLGWPAPQAAARLYLAMINEAATLEQRAGQARTDVREVLWDFLDGGP